MLANITIAGCCRILCLNAAFTLGLRAPVLAVELHVSVHGDDAHSGTLAAPLRTIQRAADLAQAGDVVTVHAGVYREQIAPPRGGSSDERRIVFQAAPGERIEIKGSEVLRKWTEIQAGVWKATIANTKFGKFNPYSDVLRGDWFDPRGRQHHTGAVYLNGEWLAEAAALDDVMQPPGQTPLWFGRVEPHQTTLWAQGNRTLTR